MAIAAARLCAISAAYVTTSTFYKKTAFAKLNCHQRSDAVAVAKAGERRWEYLPRYSLCAAMLRRSNFSGLKALPLFSAAVVRASELHNPHVSQKAQSTC